MRVAVVADIHANLEAFRSVLEDARTGGPIDAVWSLGDLVGYGPEPSACIALLRSYPHWTVAGNHDLAATGAIGIDDFNPFAAEAARWTASTLSEVEKLWLRGLPEVLVQDDFTLVHGSLRDPVWEYLVSPAAAEAHFALLTTPFSLVGHSHIPLYFKENGGWVDAEALQDDFTLVHGSLRDPVWEYLVSPAAAEAHFALQTTPFSLVGHSHIPLCFKENGAWVDAEALQDGETVELGGNRLILNPGGVGQPRDGDSRASYATLDTEARRWQLHRVAYNIAATQRKMLAVGLPEYLIERLARGR